LGTEKTNKELRKFIHKEIYEILKKHGSLLLSEFIKYIQPFDEDQYRNKNLIN